MARPRKWNPKKIAKQIDEYVDTHPLPFLACICSDLDICSKDRLLELAQECDELSYAIKRSKDKCEAGILKGSLKKDYSESVGIFLLKNYGWSDKQEQEIDLGCTVTISGGDEYAQ